MFSILGRSQSLLPLHCPFILPPVPFLQRVVELEEKLRESVRACTREKERVLHFKALTKTAKGRLEETLRLTRTTRPANLTRQRSMSALPTARVLSMSVGGPNQQKENPPRTFVQATEEAYREKLAALEKELAAAQVDNLGLRMKMGTLEQRAPAGGGGNALPKSPLGRTASVLGPGVAELSAEVQGLRAQLAEVPRLRTEAAEAERWRREAEEVPRLRQELEELRRLAKELDEVPRLRRELADARAAAAMVADAGFGVNHRSTVQGGSFGGNKIGGESSNLSAELRTAWERVTSLQKRYDAAAEALASINGNHEKALQQLEETHRQLNQVA